MNLLKCPACGVFLPLKWPFSSMICRQCGQPLADTPRPPAGEAQLSSQIPITQATGSRPLSHGEHLEGQRPDTGAGDFSLEPEQYSLPTLMICYYPVRGDHIDQAVTGDVGAPLDKIRRHVQQTTRRVIEALEQGSCYRGYKDPLAKPSLRYEIVDTLEFLEPLPTYSKAGHRVPMTDYNAIMQRIGIREWVEQRGIKEVWLWGYHGGVIDLWESNMAGPFGDISNSDRDPRDLPVLSRTYTVYHYNYGRGPSEAVEDHIHQIEAVLKYINMELFWKKFVGRPGEGRCGWAHYPPNAVRDYDWANPSYVWTDIEDWRPDGGGPKKKMNCKRWNCDSLTWFIYWMQNLPGANNNLTYQSRPLTNWWRFIGDFDEAMRQRQNLVH